LIPTEDYCTALLSENKAELSRDFIVSVGDWDTVAKTIDKRLTYETAERVGIPVPQSLFPDSIGEVRREDGLPNYPCLVKPLVSHRFQRVLGCKLHVVNNHSDLLDKARQALENRLPVMIQEIIPGGDDQIYVYASYHDRTGEPLAEFTGRKIRQVPPGYGTTRVMVSTNTPAVIQLSRKLLGAIGYTGLCDVEFKRDPRDGEYKLIEINARSGKWISAVSACGMNLPWIMYVDLARNQKTLGGKHLVGIHWIHLYDDILTPFLHWKDETGRLRDYFAPYFGQRAFAVCDRDDWRPFLKEWTNLPQNLLRHLGSAGRRVHASRTAGSEQEA
jgi:predicted ATP-grasp superfamily ATP-dependent carboligase